MWSKILPNKRITKPYYKAQLVYVMSFFSMITVFSIHFSKASAAPSFTQLYLRGKLLYKQKLYVDAIKELVKATTLTARGRNHFGAHYYLARAYFWRPNIRKAMKAINKAQTFIKNKPQREAYKKTLRQIRALYGKVTIVPEVDPDDVGRLMFTIKPKSAFSHRHKKRYYRILIKRIKKEGGLKPDATLYLPKGEYEIGLKRNQCLQYGLFQNDKVTKTLEVGSEDVSLNLKAKKSCSCPSNQLMIKDPQNPKHKTCSCSPGSVWDAKRGECKKAKAQNVIPWVILGVTGGLAVVGAAIAVPLILNQKPTDNFLITGGFN